MATEAQKRAAARYEKEHVRRKVVKFFPADADLLEHLESQPRQNAYIKELIRRDMAGM